MVKKWHLKAAVQKSISFLPFKNDINFWFQKNITKGVALTDQYFTYKIQSARDHIDFDLSFDEYKTSDKIVLELGTGWYPIVPIAYFLTGYKETIAIDLSNWLTKNYIKTAIAKFIEWRKLGYLQAYLPNIIESRWNFLEEVNDGLDLSIEELCAGIHFIPIVGDASKTSFENESFHLISSNNTFEHIYPKVLTDILVEFKRILKPNGAMSHFIDMSDHFSHLDSSISNFNFLKYSKTQWQI